MLSSALDLLKNKSSSFIYLFLILLLFYNVALCPHRGYKAERHLKTLFFISRSYQ